MGIFILIQSMSIKPQNNDSGFKIEFQGSHIAEKNEANRSVLILRKVKPFFPRFSLLKLYKSFVRPHLTYEDVTMSNQIIYHVLKKSNLFNIWQQLITGTKAT